LVFLSEGIRIASMVGLLQRGGKRGVAIRQTLPGAGSR
jgi:hypothetical protein